LFVGRSRKAQHKPPNDFAALGSCRVWGQGDWASQLPNTHIRWVHTYVWG